MSDTPPTEFQPRAFILGAGLGTRLRPLTNILPKPLVPIKGRPLVTHALDHLATLSVNKVIINTHHVAHKWEETFPTLRYDNMRLAFRYEPVLLDTGGGLKNVEDFFEGRGTFCIYNGDILSNLPLVNAWNHHRKSQNLVTMVLRSSGGPLHVALDSDGRVVDIRNLLKTGQEGAYLFTGIHFVEPEIFKHIPTTQVQSIIPIYLDLIRRGLRVGGIVLDQGDWSDVGTLSEYERLR